MAHGKTSMKENLKSLIIKMLESEGEASKSRVEDYLKELKGTTGDCCSRRLRELVSSGIVSKMQKEHNGKKYFAYRVNPPLPTAEDFKRAREALDRQVPIGPVRVINVETGKIFELEPIKELNQNKLI